MGQKEKKLRWKVGVLTSSPQVAPKAPLSRSCSKTCPEPSTQRNSLSHLLHYATLPAEKQMEASPDQAAHPTHAPTPGRNPLGLPNPTLPPPGTGSSLPLGIIIIIVIVIRTIITVVVKSTDSKLPRFESQLSHSLVNRLEPIYIPSLCLGFFVKRG